MRRILAYAASHGVNDFVLNLHHLPETITRAVGDGSDLNVRVRYSFESPVLGSAGGPRRALPLLPDDTFFIINGDTLTSVDLGALANDHASSGALVTIAVIPNDRPDRYGGLVVDSTGRFHSVVPPGSRVRSYHVVGVQAASPEAFRRLPPNEPAESIGGLYKELVLEDRGSVRAFLCDADFLDVGTPGDYLEASRAVARREAHPLPHIGQRSVVEPGAETVDSVIWDDVVIGAGASLARCIVADGVSIPAGARFEDCAIVADQGGLKVVDIT